MDNHLIPVAPQRIQNVPSEMVQGGLEKLAQKRRTLVNVAPPSSLSKSRYEYFLSNCISSSLNASLFCLIHTILCRKMAGIDPKTQDESYHETFNLESVMLQRMKESYSVCNYLSTHGLYYNIFLFLFKRIMTFLFLI